MIIYLKRLKSSKFVRVKAFPIYGGIGVSAPSLHGESIRTERQGRKAEFNNRPKRSRGFDINFYYADKILKTEESGKTCHSSCPSFVNATQWDYVNTFATCSIHHLTSSFSDTTLHNSGTMASGYHLYALNDPTMINGGATRMMPPLLPNSV